MNDMYKLYAVLRKGNVMENKNIFVLWGKGSIGKTHTLNNLIIEFHNNSAKSILLKISEANAVNFPSTADYKDFCKQDHIAIFEINNKKVGISTRGDDDKCIIKDFSDIDALCECDVYVCACRTRGSSKRYICDLEKDNRIFCHAGWSITSKPNYKGVEDFRNGVDKLQAQELYKEIISI